MIFIFVWLFLLNLTSSSLLNERKYEWLERLKFIWNHERPEIKGQLKFSCSKFILNFKTEQNYLKVFWESHTACCWSYCPHPNPGDHKDSKHEHPVFSLLGSLISWVQHNPAAPWSVSESRVSRELSMETVSCCEMITPVTELPAEHAQSLCMSSVGHTDTGGVLSLQHNILYKCASRVRSAMGRTVRNQRTLCCFLLTCSSAGARLINYELPYFPV